MSRHELPTLVGRAERGENQFRGFAVGSQLAGNTTNWAALALAVGHRPLSQRECEVLDDMVVCSLAADPHIWPLKVTRIVAAFGAVVPALAAGILCTAGGFMGWGTYAPAATFLLELAGSPNPSATLELRLKRSGRVPGFGVAYRVEDERAVAFRGRVRARGFDRGLHWQTLLTADDRLREAGAPANIAAVSAAMLLDLGFTPQQINALGPLLLLPNYLANAVEGAEQAPQILRTLPAEAIEDRTPPARLSPRAQAKRK